MSVDNCPICDYAYSKEGKQEKETVKCSKDDCESMCVKNSDLCQVHNRIRYPIMCLACNKSCCRACYSTYFLSEEDDITRCVHCKKLFDIEFLLGEDSNSKQRFPKTWVWKELKEHKEKVLLDKIMAKMPSYQRAASAINKINQINKAINDHEAQIREIQTKQNDLIRLKSNQKFIIDNCENSKATSKLPSYVTRGKCPAENCNGFIEDKWECGRCSAKICSHCMMIKHEGVTHTCDEEHVKSTTFIRETTKPCPSCRARIYRSEGCFAENTEILMYDNSLKMSQDIKVGDELVGDDGNKRIVLELVSGTDKMYEIEQSNGDSYTVNSKHTLVLTDSSNEIHQIMVDDYLAMNDKEKKKFYGIKSVNGINYDEQPVKLDPYQLGCWIGGGKKNHKFSEKLKVYNIDNKHIPKEYLMNSRQVRLSLLAGLVDINSYMHNRGKDVMIVQEDKYLSEQIASLAIGLGFAVSFEDCQRYNIIISGNKISEIPTFLKYCVNSEQIIKSRIKVKYVGDNKYYGWKINENNLFLAKDHTILRNCSQIWCTNCHVFFCWNSGEILKKTAFIHNPHYTDFINRNGLVADNVNGCPRQINHNSFTRLKLTREAIKRYSTLYRKSQHILDQVTRYEDPIEHKIKDISIKFINNEVTKEDLPVFVQKYHKASKKNELANLRRTTYANMMIEILTKLCFDANGKNEEQLKTICIEIDRMLQELEEITLESMINIGKMFNSNTPDITSNFVDNGY
jgi:hypothetical protein